MVQTVLGKMQAVETYGGAYNNHSRTSSPLESEIARTLTLLRGQPEHPRSPRKRDHSGSPDPLDYTNPKLEDMQYERRRAKEIARELKRLADKKKRRGYPRHGHGSLEGEALEDRPLREQLEAQTKTAATLASYAPKVGLLEKELAAHTDRFSTARLLKAEMIMDEKERIKADRVA